MNFVTETPIRAKAAAELMGVHRDTIDEWFAGGLENRKIGGLVYTTREAIERFSLRRAGEEAATSSVTAQRSAVERAAEARKQRMALRAAIAGKQRRDGKGAKAKQIPK